MLEALMQEIVDKVERGESLTPRQQRIYDAYKEVVMKGKNTDGWEG